MCLIAWDWQPQSETPLLLIANRDEYYARPARPLHWWPGHQVLAGQDLQAGGTWLGVDRHGRMAALTNHRQAGDDGRERPSRGALVREFLRGELDAPAYLAQVLRQGLDYKPFNLLLWDGRQLMGLESRARRVIPFAPGISGVSNADFDTPWPKLQRWKQALQQRHPAEPPTLHTLLPLMHDRSRCRLARNRPDANARAPALSPVYRLARLWNAGLQRAGRGAPAGLVV